MQKTVPKHRDVFLFLILNLFQKTPLEDLSPSNGKACLPVGRLTRGISFKGGSLPDRQAGGNDIECGLTYEFLSNW